MGLRARRRDRHRGHATGGRVGRAVEEKLVEDCGILGLAERADRGPLADRLAALLERLERGLRVEDRFGRDLIRGIRSELGLLRLVRPARPLIRYTGLRFLGIASELLDRNRVGRLLLRPRTCADHRDNDRQQRQRDDIAAEPMHSVPPTPDRSRRVNRRFPGRQSTNVLDVVS